MGLAEDERVRRAIHYVEGMVRENGWPCAVSKELGSFRGPGRKQNPCPFATLAMLKALSAFNDLRDNPASRAGVEVLLNLWQNSLTEHPYIFYRRLSQPKVPFIWYDLMHVLEVLTRFPFALEDPRLQDMAEVFHGKMDGYGRFTLESVWMAW